MWNDKETDLDLLGNKRIAQTIISIMNEQELRPLTIGVYGSWGVGKSSVLKLIENQLLQDKDTLCITFNAWLFQGYEDTRSALMETVVSEIVRLQPFDQKILRLGKSLFKRINWLKVAKSAGTLALTTLSGMPSPALWGLPGILKSAKDLFSSKESKKEDNDDDSKENQDDDPWLKDEEETVPGQIHAFRKELRTLIEKSKVSRIVVLVDELDRCLPNAVIDILEAIRLFLFVEGTVFVLAADEQMVEYAVRKHFPDLPVSQADYTKHYLEKLVQVPFRVPSLNQLQTKNYVRFLLLQHELHNDKIKLEELCNAFEASKESPYDNRDVTYDFIKSQLGTEKDSLQHAMMVADQLGAILADELRGNPRNIKRFLNSLFLRLRIADIYKIRDKVQLDVVTKLMVLERFHSAVYDAIISQAGNSRSGTAELIASIESAEDNASIKKVLLANGITTTNDKELEQLREWRTLRPALKDADFRPYIFVSSEKAVVISSSDELPHALKPIFDVLVGGVRMQMVVKEQDIKALSEAQADQLFTELANIRKSTSDWSKVEGPIAGIIYLVSQKNHLETKLIELLQLIPSKSLKPWVVSNLSGFRSFEGLKAKDEFLTKIDSSSDAPSNVKTLAKQSKNT